MVAKLKMRKMGGSLATVIPKDMAERMNLREGDEVFAIETKDGFLLSHYDPEFEAAMAAFEIGRKRYRNALRELAK